LPGPLKRKFGGLILLVFLTSIIDLAGLASFIPIISLISNPGLLSESNWLSILQQKTGIQTFERFVIFLFSCAVVLMVFRLGFIVLSQRIQAKFVFDLVKFIGVKTYSHFLNSSFEEFSKRELAQVVRELSISTQHFARFLVIPLLLISSELILLIMVIAGIAFYNIQVFLLLMLTVLPVTLLFQFLVRGRLKRYGDLEHKFAPQLYANSVRGSHGFIDVKLRNKEKTLISDYEKVFSVLNRVSINTNTFNIIPAKLFELVTVVGLLVIAIYGFFIATESSVVLPLITVYAAAGYRIIPSLSRIIPSLMQLVQYQYLFKIYKPVFESAARQKEEEQLPQSVHFAQEVRVDNLSFKFSNAPAFLFENISLNIKKGEILGFIGKSGSGKTTLVNLIAGFYSPTQGTIWIDNQPLNNSTRTSWWSKISYVQQSSYLEKGTLASNIAFLENDVDEQKLMDCIKAACLTELLGNKKPDEVEVAESGKNLSGGQKQRIIIARALYHNSELIILDEATSALDIETENEINETIKNLKNTGITILIIAHRYSTLKNTSRIIRMQGGRIVEELQYDNITS
jgi:ABC-type multidrug transport system fused ATPase/permease subunit